MHVLLFIVYLGSVIRADIMKSFSSDPRQAVCEQKADGPDCRKFRDEWKGRAYNSVRGLIVKMVNEDQIYGNLEKELTRINKRIAGLRSVVHGIPGAEPGLIDIYSNIFRVSHSLQKTLVSQAANYTTAIDQNQAKTLTAVQQLTTITSQRLDDLLKAFQASVDKQAASQAVQISDLGVSASRLLEDTSNQAAAVAKAYTDRVDEAKAEIASRLDEAAKLVADLKKAVKESQSSNLAVARQARMNIKTAHRASKAKLKALKTGIEAMIEADIETSATSTTALISDRLAKLESGLQGERKKIAASQEEFRSEANASLAQASRSVAAVKPAAAAALTGVQDSVQAGLRSVENFSNSSLTAAKSLASDQASQATQVASLSSAAAASGRVVSDRMAASVKGAVAQSRQQLAGVVGSVASGVAGQLGSADEQIADVASSGVASARSVASQSLASVADTQKSAATQTKTGAQSSARVGAAVESLNAAVGAQAALVTQRAETKTRAVAASVDQALQASAATLAETNAVSTMRVAQARGDAASQAAAKTGKFIDSVATLEQRSAEETRALERKRQAAKTRTTQQQGAAAAAVDAMTVAAQNVNREASELASAAAATAAQSRARYSAIQDKVQTSAAATQLAVTAAERRLGAETDVAMETAVAKEKALAAEDQRQVQDEVRRVKEAKRLKENLMKDFERNTHDALGKIEGKADALSEGLMALSDSLGVEEAALNDVLKSRANVETANLATLQSKLNRDVRTVSASLEALTEAELEEAQTASLQGGAATYETTKETLNNMFPKFVDIVDNIHELLSVLLMRGDQVALNQSKLAALGEELVVKKKHFSSQETARMTAFVGELDAWRDDVFNRTRRAEDNITDALHELPDILAKSLDNYTADVKTDIARFGRFVTRIEEAFEKQSAVENKYATESYIQLMAAVSGISEATVRARVQYLSKILNAGQVAKERRLSALQIAASLSEALRQAKADGKTKFAEMKELLSVKRNDFASLAESFTVSLDQGLGYVQAEEVATTLSQYRRLYSEAATREQQIDGLGSRIAAIMDALERGERDQAMKLAESNQQVAGLAATLQSMDAESRRQLLTLMRQIETGELTFDDAIASAREVNAAKISSLNDVIKGFNKVIAAYVHDSKKIFKQMRHTVRKFREYANFKTTDAMLQNKAMLTLLAPNLEVLEVKADLLRSVAPNFLNKTQHDLIHTQEVLSDAIDTAEVAIRDAKDTADSVVRADKNRERQADRLVDGRTKQEKIWLDTLINKARESILGKMSFLQEDDHNEDDIIHAEVRELVRRALRTIHF